MQIKPMKTIKIEECSMNKESLFQRLIIFSIESYLDDINNDTTYNYNTVLKLRTSIRSYIWFHKFSPQEDKVLKHLAETDTMKNMSSMLVDRTIFAIELLYLYVTKIPKNKRAHLNMSDKKLLNLKSILTIDMLKLNKKDTDSYKRVKEIVDDSRIAAKKYFFFIENYIKEIK